MKKFKYKISEYEERMVEIEAEDEEEAREKLYDGEYRITNEIGDNTDETRVLNLSYELRIEEDYNR